MKPPIRVIDDVTMLDQKLFDAIADRIEAIEVQVEVKPTPSKVGLAALAMTAAASSKRIPRRSLFGWFLNRNERR